MKQGNIKNAGREISKLKAILQFHLNKSATDIDWDEVKRLRRNIEELWKQEEAYWSQRSRVHWLKWGDRNSKFFHASTIQRRNRNILHRIKDHLGNWLEGQQEVMQGVWQFFQNLYSSEPTDMLEECLQVVPGLVTQDMNSKLLAPVTHSEVDKAVFSMGSLKAPGPDGFNGLFFQQNWVTIKEDIYKAVDHFFSSGILHNEVNATIVALVPKILLPESISHLRPISC